MEERSHREIRKRWETLGKKLGFKTRKLTRKESKGTDIDVIWWDDLNGKLPYERLWIPAVAIEIETSHIRKSFKADIVGFNTLKPQLGIIHAVGDLKTHRKSLETALKTIQGYMDMQANSRVILFRDPDLRKFERKAKKV